MLSTMLASTARRLGLALTTRPPPVVAAEGTARRTLTASSVVAVGSGREEPLGDGSGSCTHCRGTPVQAPQPNMQLPDPAEQAPSILERVQDALLRPSFASGRAYHYAEDSARMTLQEQLASGKGAPGVETMYAPVEATGDVVTAPRSWHFSNRPDQLDEKRQEEVAAQAAQNKRTAGD